MIFIYYKNGNYIDQTKFYHFYDNEDLVQHKISRKSSWKTVTNQLDRIAESTLFGYWAVIMFIAQCGLDSVSVLSG